MIKIKEFNIKSAEKLKSILNLNSEPVAIKLIKKGEEYPSGYNEPDKQQSHCKAVADARNGICVKMSKEMQGCAIGASALGMTETPEKVANGEFHNNIGLHDNISASKKMIDERDCINDEIIGEIICPLKDANFEPDVVVFIDIPERLYWLESMITYNAGGRLTFSTAPAQCLCEDVVVIPFIHDKLNISLGCFGCRKRTSIKPEEMAAGIPYSKLPEMMDALELMSSDILLKAKRD